VIHKNQGRRVLIFCFAITALACSDTPPTITVPPDVVSAIVQGAVIVEQLETNIFSEISTEPGKGIDFRKEWMSAPGMTMIGINPTIIDNVNRLAALAGSAVPPLEHEIVACESATGNNLRTPFPAAYSYNRPVIQAVVADGEDDGEDPDLVVSFGSLQNISGKLVNFRIVPDRLPDPLPSVPGPGQIMLADGSFAVTGFTLSAVATNIHIGLEHAAQHYNINIDSIMLVCHAVIVPATAGVDPSHRSCGDVNIHCDSPPIAVVGGYSSDLYLSFLLDPALSIGGPLGMGAILSGMATRGFNLHFENYAALAFAFFGSASSTTLGLRGASSVRPDGTSSCSPVALPEPPPAPTRALSRMIPQTGAGQLHGSQGGVKPYVLVPEAEIELRTDRQPNAVQHKFPSWAVLDTRGHEAIYGMEALGYSEKYFTGIPFTPEYIVGRLRVVRRYPRDCWVEQSDSGKMREFIASSEEALVQYVNADGKEELRHDYADSVFGIPEEKQDSRLQDRFEGAGGSMAQLIAVDEADYTRDIIPELEKLGVEPCRNDCAKSKWTKATFITGRKQPLGPWVGDPRLPFNPSEVIVWLDRDSRQIAEVFGPSLNCGFAQEEQESIRDERLASPSVVFNSLMMDQATIPSLGFGEYDSRDTFVRSIVQLPSGPALAITLTARCTDIANPAPSNTCWSESLFNLPPAGYVAISSGFSGTTVPRISMARAMQGHVQEPGGRIAAIHGLQDRSTLATYTSVPKVYRDIGLTTKTFDYRGSRTFDWKHDIDFPAIGGPTHIAPSKLEWLKVPRLFYPDWSSGEVLVLGRGVAMYSLCPLPEQLFATPTQLEFSGGGLSIPKTVAAGAILSTGTQSAGEYRVSPTDAAWGSAGRIFLATPSP
jgi:hypothetical protein